MPLKTEMCDTKISMAKANRKIAKPIMEKKRRARINASLNELKSLLVEVLQKEGCRHSSKMEKADILEMAVRHLKNLQKQQAYSGTSTHTLRDSYPPAIPLEKYATALPQDCLPPEINRYLGRSTRIDSKPSPDPTATSPGAINHDVNQKILPTSQPAQSISISTAALPISSNSTTTTATLPSLPGNTNTVMQPMMTRTASGEIAVVLPQHILQQTNGQASSGFILPIYTVPQTMPVVDKNISQEHQPVMISINMPTLQQSQGSAFSLLSSSSTSSSQSGCSQPSPMSPVWRPW